MTRVGFLGVALLAVGCTEAPPSPDDGSAAVTVAKLTHLAGKVVVKRSNGDDWMDAAEAMDLRENDQVRTAVGASATLEFPSGGTLSMSEDSLVAIAETRIRPGQQERSDVTVLRGRVNAELPDTRTQSISVTTPHATVRAGRKIEFR
ncbi:MAG TPA: FecR domain-containing protein [Myxococcaceae bacterium]|nr:FecR domain-containing protein [Myxococcaceae bacterium]